MENGLFNAEPTEHLVAFDGSFDVSTAPTAPTGSERPHARKRLKAANAQLDKLQQVLMAGDNHAVLLIFQAMDAAGKDSTIRAVMQGINPAGCQVFSFKRPSALELDHDFLWRSSIRLPERGRIGIFNRSHYEEVLVVRVHPDILEKQKLPHAENTRAFWDARLASIHDQELHLARNGTIILKFWLNVSLDEQRRRFLRRLDHPDKHWKFSAGDVAEREFWPQYMSAYQEALNATSRPWAPWYAIPADDKPYMRAAVAETIVAALSSARLEYPEPSAEELATFDQMRKILNDDPPSR
jgi:PPK2 family polyphosphate:nucleotide phosphotransferase